MNQRAMNLQMIADLHEHLDGQPTAILFANTRDWLNIRRDFQKTYISAVRYERTHIFKIYYQGKWVADLVIDMHSRLPLPKGKLFLQHRTDLLAQKVRVVFEPQEWQEFNFRSRFGLSL